LTGEWEVEPVYNISIEQIRLNHIRKQLSLENRRIDFYEVARSHIGLHSTDYWTPYLSVWARIGDYDAQEVFDSLNSGRRVVRVNAFRSTVHVVHLDNLSMIIQATGPRLYRRIRRTPLLRDCSDRQVESMIVEVVDVLKEEPLRMRELKQALPHIATQMRAIILLASAQGKVVRATAAHARSTLTTYAALDKWVPGFAASNISEDEALRMLIRHYIDVFGPATVNDIAWWIPSTKTKVREILHNLSDEIKAFELGGATRYAIKNDMEIASSLEPPDDPVIWFLPYEDHLPKAFIERSWFADDKLLPQLFPRSAQHYWPRESTPKRVVADAGGVNQSGEIRPSIWLNGRIVGRWEFGQRKERQFVAYDLYANVPAKYKQMIVERKEQLEEFVNERLVSISRL